MKLRAIAYVLPQFHQIPENDSWWGAGFTEWTNVKKAKPLFKNHNQPEVPTVLGYYDLSQSEARASQAKLAKSYGIYGFCYYHYWFNGKRLLHKPIDGMLKQQSLNMPFMLCWANENWTRRWDGREEDILMKQEYSFQDDKEHMRWLCRQVFKDERYITVNGCPVFLVYRQDLFPDITKTIKIWREIATKEFGFKGLYVMNVESFDNRIMSNKKGFDASVEFSPHRIIKYPLKETFLTKFLIKLKLKERAKLKFRDYKRGIKESIDRLPTPYKLFRCVTPGFDNTPRKKDKAYISVGSTPKVYCNWLKHLVRNCKTYSEDENFVFINAMNEWGEGNHLEPCRKYGDAYLRATKKALKNA